MKLVKHAPCILLMAMIATGLPGCQSHSARDTADQSPGYDAPSAIVLGEGQPYGQVFDAAREVLMDYRFAIDRVDARLGVITTYPKRTAGLASPWDREQSSMNQEWEDLVNEQRRVVRVEFDQDEQGGASATVSVELLRTHRPGWRVETESVRLSNHALRRDVNGELEPGSYLELVGLDAEFASRLALAIQDRLRDEAGEP